MEIGDWEQPFYADTPGTQCPQGGGIFDWTHPGYDDIGEDCLHLNVFTPTVKSLIIYTSFPTIFQFAILPNTSVIVDW